MIKSWFRDFDGKLLNQLCYNCDPSIDGINLCFGPCWLIIGPWFFVISRVLVFNSVFVMMHYLPLAHPGTNNSCVKFRIFLGFQFDFFLQNKKYKITIKGYESLHRLRNKNIEKYLKNRWNVTKERQHGKITMAIFAFILNYEFSLRNPFAITKLTRESLNERGSDIMSYEMLKWFNRCRSLCPRGRKRKEYSRV